MKRFYSFLSLLLAVVCSGNAAEVIGNLTCVYEGETFTVECPYTVLTVDEETMTGTIALGEGSWFSSEWMADVKGEVTVPSSITDGGITYTVTELSRYAFATLNAGQGCYYMTAVNLPNTLTAIRTRAFSFLTNLTAVDFYTVEGVEEAPLTIESNVFRLCTGLTNVDNILARTGSLGDFAFYGCTGLTSIYLHDDGYSNKGLAYEITFGTNPFAYCSNLESIDVETGTTWSHDADDSPLNAIFGAAPYNGDDDYMVTGCKNSRFYSDSWPKQVGDYAFAGCTGLVSLPVASGLWKICQYAFLGCTSLTSLDVPNMNQIESYAFDGCTSLEKVNFGGTLYIKDYTFRGCTSLKSIVLPETMYSIGSYAFSGCTALESVVIPSSITSISGRTFTGCTALKNVIVYLDTPITYKNETTTSPFYTGIDYENATLYVPAGSKEAYEAAKVWRKFGTIKEQEGFDVTVTKAGLATMYVDRPLLIPEDDDLLGVFYGTSTEGDVLKMRKVKDFIPANTGVVIMANEGTYTFPWRWTENEIADNVISGVLEDTPKADVMSEKGYRQILTLGQGKTGAYIGFYKFTGTTLGANKAFIGLETEGSGEVKLQFEDGTETGIENLNLNVNDNANANNGVYDLSGRRVSQPTRGLYIVNGKKVLF